MDSNKVRQVLSELGLAPSKLRGQNFLCDINALENIIEFARLETGVDVVEIGPGLGALTSLLLEDDRNVCSIEIDRGFAQYLRSKYSDNSKFQLIEQDVRKVSLEKLAQASGTSSFQLVGNIPYSISTELVIWAVLQRQYLSSVCYLMHKEFAERIAASPGSKAYGSLSVLCAQHFDCYLGPEVSGDKFYPKANVTSRVIRFEPLASTRYEVSDDFLFERLVRALFAQRRKTILNNLRNALGDIGRDDLLELLGACGVDSKRRPETVSLEEFVELYRELEVRGALEKLVK